MAIDVLRFDPPSTNPKHSTSSLTSTIKFNLVIVQIELWFRKTREMYYTDSPAHVLRTLFELKYVLE
ncbi:hypothetical protein U1Q18_024271, partial [Sarracenia purpurea var. burkii]